MKTKEIYPNKSLNNACIYDINKDSFRRDPNFVDVADLLKLNEGLISSYPFEAATKMLKNEFGLTDEQIIIKEDDDFGNIALTYHVFVDPCEVNVTKLLKRMKAFGYLPVKKPETIFKQAIEGREFRIVFEARFGQKVDMNHRFLYHMTPTDKVIKILKNGLTPRSNNSRFDYPERVYLISKAVDNEFDDEQLEVLKAVQFANIKEQEKLVQYSLLSIDLRKANTNNFYIDPLSYGSYYTYDNIPPDAITLLGEFNLYDDVDIRHMLFDAVDRCLIENNGYFDEDLIKECAPRYDFEVIRTFRKPDRTSLVFLSTMHHITLALIFIHNQSYRVIKVLVKE